jgi:hypothetical protein
MVGATSAGSAIGARSTKRAVGKLVAQLGGDLERQAGLADPARPHQRNQRTLAHKRFELLDLALAAFEAGHT